LHEVQEIVDILHAFISSEHHDNHWSPCKYHCPN
jgi:hypothetical protein